MFQIHIEVWTKIDVWFRMCRSGSHMRVMILMNGQSWSRIFKYADHHIISGYSCNYRTEIFLHYLTDTDGLCKCYDCWGNFFLKTWMYMTHLGMLKNAYLFFHYVLVEANTTPQRWRTVNLRQYPLRWMSNDCKVLIPNNIRHQQSWSKSDITRNGKGKWNISSSMQQHSH